MPARGSATGTRRKLLAAGRMQTALDAVLALIAYEAAA
jgi:hypothetical protein